MCLVFTALLFCILWEGGGKKVRVSGCGAGMGPSVGLPEVSFFFGARDHH